MKVNLISGLYRRIKEYSQNDISLSSTENEAVNIMNGLIEFVNRNPDLTNNDIKLLAKTDEKKERYILILFKYFPNLVKEIRTNGSKNLQTLIVSKLKASIHYEDLAEELNKFIKCVCISNKTLKLGFKNKHNYKYYNLILQKNFNQTIVTESYESVGGSSGIIRYATDLTIKEAKQILGLIDFYKEHKVSSSELEAILNNVRYDFRVIKKIADNIANEELKALINKDEIGFKQLFEKYQWIIFNEKRQQI